jgi:hypothetical protein
MLNLIKRLIVGKDRLEYLPQPNLEIVETVEFPRVCTVYDKRYIVRHVRYAGGVVYNWVDSVKINAKGGGQYAVPGESITLGSQSIRHAREICPWCGAQGIVYCKGYCNQWVCKGRTRKKRRGDFFQCRDSCGCKSFLIVAYNDFEGSRSTEQPPSRPEQAQPQQIAPQSNRPSLPANSNAKALPGLSNRRLLK